MACSETPPPCLRLISWNVHMWHTRSYRPNVDDVIRVLRGLIGGEETRAKLTVVALQEVTGDEELAYLAAALGLQLVAYGSTESLGNPILVDASYDAAATSFASVEQAVRLTGRETRSISGGTFRWPCGAAEPFRIFNLHLDHIDEDVRLRQLNFIFSKVVPAATSPFVLVGDFNALHRPDYTDRRWQDVFDVRRANRWELPQTRVMDDLLQRRKLLDSFGLVHSYPRLVEATKQLHSSLCSDCRDREAVESCWVGTRVDYHLLSPDFLTTSGHTVATHRFRTDVASTREPSDHLPVVTEFHCCQSNIL